MASNLEADRKAQPQKRKPSDIIENSPKRIRITFPDDTPDWAQVLFLKLDNRISDLESTLTSAIEYATDTAVQALAETGKLQLQIRNQSLEIESLKSQVSQSKSDHNKLLEKVNRLENQSRRDNLLFYGFKEERNEDETAIKRKLFNLLTTQMRLAPHVVENMKVVRCHRKGPYVQGRDRPIIVKMHWFQDRKVIWESKSHLKGTEFYINEDFSDLTESRRRDLYPILKAARNNAKYRDNVSINVDRLILNGRTYTVEQLNSLPADLQPSNLATEVSPTLVKFFRKASVFSNFHHSPFTLEGKSFKWVEQYYQVKKAVEFGDDVATSRIMNATTAFQCYQAGCEVTGFNLDTWHTKCDGIMKKGLVAKFTSNPYLRKTLEDTGTRVIAECNGKDKYWGIGLYPDNPLSNDTRSWCGENKLGQLLMDVRQDLKDE